MDLDATLMTHGTRLKEIESFVERVKALMSGADENVSRASDQLDGLLAFKSEVEGMLPMIEKAVNDVSAVTADLAAIKQDLAPALAWIAERQKADEEAKAAEQQKVADAAKAQEQAAADQAAKVAAEPKQPTLDTVSGDLPAASEPAQQSETEQTVG
jgi:peptidoglycan hydrolase CwlO-like protein